MIKLKKNKNLLGFTPSEAEQSLRGMELHYKKKKHKKIKAYRKSV